MRIKVFIVPLLFVMLTVAAAGAREDYPPRRDPGPPPPRHGEEREKREPYSIEQAVSDRAQINTIAFSGLAFMTGSLGCDTFIPPGKICDHFGFQYMRDVQDEGMGHNTDFLTRIANAMMDILTDSQLAQLITLAKSQEKRVETLALKRLPLIKAFRRQLEGRLPKGSSGLSRTAVMSYVSDIFALDGLLTLERADVYGNILRHLSKSQKARLSGMAFGDYTTWPEVGDRVDLRSLSHGTHVLLMTYASDLFSWYAGSVEADTYFCPERHATYFGGFYMKDAPAMGRRNYTLSTRLTGDSGERFLDILSDGQREQIIGIVEQERRHLMDIVKTRRNIAVLLRKNLIPGSATDKKRLLSFFRHYGELDGSLAYACARGFARVSQSLTRNQRKELALLRNLDARPEGAYLFSEPIGMPSFGNTDEFFQ